MAYILNKQEILFGEAYQPLWGNLALSFLREPFVTGDIYFKILHNYFNLQLVHGKFVMYNICNKMIGLCQIVYDLLDTTFPNRVTGRRGAVQGHLMSLLWNNFWGGKSKTWCIFVNQNIYFNWKYMLKIHFCWNW